MESIIKKVTNEYGAFFATTLIAEFCDIEEADTVLDLLGEERMETHEEVVAIYGDDLAECIHRDYDGSMLIAEETVEDYLSSIATSAPTATTTTVAQSTANLVTPAPAPAAPAPAPVASATPAPGAISAANMLRDNFQSAFADWNDFRKTVDAVDDSTEIYTHDEDLQASAPGFDPVQKNLKIQEVADTPIAAAAMATTFGVSTDAVLNTMRSEGGTGLALVIGGKTVPVGSSAIDSLNARAGLTNDGFFRHWTKSSEEAARCYNRQFLNGKGGVTVIVESEKVRAVMSRMFAYAPFGKILDAFETFWRGKFPQGEVKGMYISHTLMSWDLHLPTYAPSVFSGFSNLLGSGYYPALRFATSNCGDSAFRIIPCLGVTGRNYIVPMIPAEKCIWVRHSGRGDYTNRCNDIMTRVLHSFGEADSAFNLASANINALHTINVNNAYNALLRTMADSGIPKKQGMEAASSFQNYYGSGAATAFECVVAIMNAYTFVIRDNPGNQKVAFATAMAVGKAMVAPWEARGNIPGNFAW